MKRISLGLGAAAAAAGLAWALVTTGHWPLDDRRQPATAVYALNGALGQWLFDHGGAVAPGTGAPPRGAEARASPEGLSAAELESVQRTLRADPRFSGRHRFTPAPKMGPSGRG